jgi:hypothetical protein
MMSEEELIYEATCNTKALKNNGILAKMLINDIFSAGKW